MAASTGEATALKDVLSLINQEHRLDVKNQAPKAIRHEENTSKRADAPNPSKSRMMLLLSLLSRSGRLL